MIKKTPLPLGEAAFFCAWRCLRVRISVMIGG
jgi:hypothetical protein